MIGGLNCNTCPKVAANSTAALLFMLTYLFSQCFSHSLDVDLSSIMIYAARRDSKDMIDHCVIEQEIGLCDSVHSEIVGVQVRKRFLDQAISSRPAKREQYSFTPAKPHERLSPWQLLRVRLFASFQPEELDIDSIPGAIDVLGS